MALKAMEPQPQSHSQWLSKRVRAIKAYITASYSIRVSHVRYFGKTSRCRAWCISISRGYQDRGYIYEVLGVNVFDSDRLLVDGIHLYRLRLC